MNLGMNSSGNASSSWREKMGSPLRPWWTASLPTINNRMATLSIIRKKKCSIRSSRAIWTGSLRVIWLSWARRRTCRIKMQLGIRKKLKSRHWTVFFPWSTPSSLWPRTIFRNSSDLLASWLPRRNYKTRRSDKVDWPSVSMNTRIIPERTKYKSNWSTKTRITRCNHWGTKHTTRIRWSLTSKSSWTWSNSLCTTRQIKSTASIHLITRTHLRMDRL